MMRHGFPSCPRPADRSSRGTLGTPCPSDRSRPLGTRDASAETSGDRTCRCALAFGATVRTTCPAGSLTRRHDVRRPLGAAVRERRVRVRELERRDEQVALPDREVHLVARVPRAVSLRVLGSSCSIASANAFFHVGIGHAARRPRRARCRSWRRSRARAPPAGARARRPCRPPTHASQNSSPTV